MLPVVGSFREVSSARELAQLLAIELDDTTTPAVLLTLLSGAPDAHQYLRVKDGLSHIDPGSMGLVVGRTRIFFNVERSKQLWGDAMVAAAVYAMTQSAPSAFFAASARKLYDNLRLLTDEEADVIREMFALSHGDPYRTPVAETMLTSRFHGTLVPIDDVLDRLIDKGVVAERRDGRLVVVF